MNTRTVPAVASAAFVTAAAIFILIRTEVYNPAGTPWAPLVVLLLIAGHLPLVATRLEWRTPFAIPRGGRAVAYGLAAVTALLAGWFIVRANTQLFSTPVSRDSAQLGLMTRVVARLETEQPDRLYGATYDLGDYKQHNTFAPGLAVPFAVARIVGLDWRFASMAGLGIAAALLIVVLVASAGTREFAAIPVAIFLAGAAWLILPQIAPYIHWGTTMPLWAVIACLGLAINARMALLAGVFGGVLATLNPGWLVLMPAMAALVWRCDRRSAVPALAALLLIPALAYGAYRAHWIDLWTGVLGDAFRDGEKIGVLQSWRFPNLHALGDFVSARVGIYVTAFAAVWFLALRIRRAPSLDGAVRLFLFAAFVVVLCGPTAYFFHWMAHGILLAVLAPSAVAMPAFSTAPAWKFSGVPALAGGAFLAAMVAIVGARVYTGFPESIDRPPGFHQPSSEWLLTGFHVRSEDHVWGKSPFMQTGFMLDRRVPGVMELHLGTLGGDFTPENPVTIRVNGHPKGVFRVLPGRYAYARVPVTADDVHIGFNIVDLEARWVRSPRSLNVGTDHREVSVCYLGMSYIPRGASRTVAGE